MNLETPEQDIPKTAEQILLECMTWSFDENGMRQHTYQGGEAGLAAARRIVRQRGLQVAEEWAPAVLAVAMALTPVVYLEDGTLVPRGN